MTELRKCSECGVEKELTTDNFDWRNDTKKYRAKCRECRLVANREYHVTRAANGEGKIAAKKSKEKHKDDPCSSCGINPRASGKTQCVSCIKENGSKSIQKNQNKPCATCGINPRDKNSSRCVECNALSSKKSRKNHQNDPCARCGINPRVLNSTACSSCIKIKLDEKLDEPCIICHIKPKSIWSSWCLDCGSEIKNKSIQKNMHLPCSTCGLNPRAKGGTQCKECRGISRKNSQVKLKQETINEYGGKCECCGEMELAFLTIGHSFGDGAADRKKLGIDKTVGGGSFYQKIKGLGYPKDKGYVVECYNCNCGANANGGICPHKQMKLRLVGN